MLQGNCADYFLGANTPAGFRGVFADVYNVRDGWRAYIIKGGPGTGKSTLMRRVCEQAEQLGEPYERVWCSSDPDSLDAVLLPRIRAGIFDGTAPHVLEPVFPGACEQIVSLADCWDEAALYKNREDIAELTLSCSRCHAQAARMLACADGFRKNTALLAGEAADNEKIRKSAAQVLLRHTGINAGRPAKKPGHEAKRLLSAVTQHGVISFAPQPQIYSRVLTVRDRYYAPSAVLLGYLRSMLLECGEDIITCACSQEPERLEHILVPSHALAICVCNDFHEQDGNMRALHTERYLRADFPAANKQRLAFNRRAAAQFTSLASQEMAQAKLLHDRLEAVYIAAMDFDAVNALAERTIAAIFG